MSKKISELAKQYANRVYPFQVYRDNESDEDARYLAKNPDLEGCMAQGATQKEAIDNLADARFDYIEFLLENGLPVPEPSVLSTPNPTIDTVGVSDIRITIQNTEQTIDDVLNSSFISKAIEKDDRELLYEASLEASVVHHSDDDTGIQNLSSKPESIFENNDETHLEFRS